MTSNHVTKHIYGVISQVITELQNRCENIILQGLWI